MNNGWVETVEISGMPEWKEFNEGFQEYYPDGMKVEKDSVMEVSCTLDARQLFTICKSAFTGYCADEPMSVEFLGWAKEKLRLVGIPVE
jgi:hypothetical protein